MVPIQDHTLHNIREFTNFSTSHVIPDILEKLIKKISVTEHEFLFFCDFIQIPYLPLILYLSLHKLPPYSIHQAPPHYPINSQP